MAYDNSYGVEEAAHPSSRYLRWVLAVFVLIFVLWLSSSAIVTVWLNLKEFGELFIRPIYYWLYGGMILSALAVVRFDFLKRRSLTFWLVRLFWNTLRSRETREGEIVRLPQSFLSFDSFRLSWQRFFAWQLTKFLLGVFFFRNMLFGMAVYAMTKGWDPKLGSVWAVFRLPFVTPPLEIGYAESTVVPMIPALTLLIGPLLGVLGFRLLVFVGFTHIVRILTPSVPELIGEPRQAGWRLGTLWGLLGLGSLWTAFNMFFPSFINYNTRYVIGGFGLIGVFFLVLALWERVKNAAKRGAFYTGRRIAVRIVPIILIGLIVFSATSINNSIADARKVEWLGPYTAQQIAVNRYLAELDKVREEPYNFSLTPVPKDEIPFYVDKYRGILSSVRLWDWDAGYAKLKPEIGLIPYVDYQDSDIIRFGGRLYWASSMRLLLPETVRPEDRWYATHLVYTHVPDGFYLLDAQEGRIVDTAQFFNQRRIYYGEGGLFEETWAAYPEGRDRSDELGGYFYEGRGGVTIRPPLSWIYEFNFFLAFRDKEVRLLRYRDVYDRMRMLFPYFEYVFEGRPVDTFPVTDGEKTYYMMPLIVRLDTWKVPWSEGNPLMRLVGYALIDVYDGSIRLIITGDDYFSELFKRLYSEYITTEVPEWLYGQTRYPEELFEWRVGMYNYYHVTDPATFIVAKEFFEIPEGLDTYFIMASPPGFREKEFIGLLSLELRGARGRNLAGYMVVRNDYPQLGEMIFYKVPLEAETKLLGPSGTMEALEKNAEFAKLKTLLREPRIGDNILYRVGDHDVYFIPVYTAGAGGVVTEMGVVACVGAAFTGVYYVGLGQNAEEAFRSYLNQLAGLTRPVTPPKAEKTLQDLLKEANMHLEAYLELWSKGEYQEAGKHLESFLNLWRQITKILSESEA
ncbi:MAG: UPF0182 family protein [Candidatus Bathyarchaeia archaeon]